MTKQITIIGGGLAGCEAALQLAKRKISVILYEMRPERFSPAHKTEYLGELVCSNSLKSESEASANGLLKEELHLLDCELLKVAESVRVPAGQALAVNREDFARKITTLIETNPYIKIIHKEITEIPLDNYTIIASGPLTSDALADSIRDFLNSENDDLYFYDAIAPIVSADSLDMEKVFLASRYDKGEAAYLNSPLTKEEYDIFYEALVTSEQFPLRDFEKGYFFQGCMPIEEIAKRGKDSLRFGLMKPVGLINPHTGKRPWAVLQLRMENKEASAYNLVGCQTRMIQSEQRRVLRLLPGLEKMEFLRYGSIHRNTYLNSPNLLLPTLQTHKCKTLLFAGQITGVEGYVESIASGLWSSLVVSHLLQNKELPLPPSETALGSLCQYIITKQAKNFQPSNINWGLIPSLPIKNKKERRKILKERALRLLKEWLLLIK